MGITNKDFEKAITSDEAASVRGKMGVEKGNRYIQEVNNTVNGRHGRHCGYD